jgi:hypothetical protein
MAAGRTVVECADQMRDEGNAEIERLRGLLTRCRHYAYQFYREPTAAKLIAEMEIALSGKGE